MSRSGIDQAHLDVRNRAKRLLGISDDRADAVIATAETYGVILQGARAEMGAQIMPMDEAAATVIAAALIAAAALVAGDDQPPEVSRQKLSEMFSEAVEDYAAVLIERGHRRHLSPKDE